MKRLLSMKNATSAARYFLILLIFSFLGWAMETVHVSQLAGELVDRGFLTLPFCPIYGCCLMLLYFLLGTPKQTRGILKNVTKGPWRYGIYWVFAGLVPTVMELIVGAFFDQLFDIQLWSYAHQPYNFMGYICLPMSLAWAFAITALMRFIYPLFQKLVGLLPDKTALMTGGILAAAVAVDAIVNFIFLFL